MVAVIGAGFGRTGTTSLKRALELVGFGPVYHMKELYDRPERLAAWLAARDGRAPAAAALAGYRAALGWPACAFLDGLLDAHPGAKVVLTTRDPDAWYDSAHRTLYRSRFDEAGEPRRLTGDTARVAEFAEDLIWRGAFGGRFTDRAHALSVLAAHERRVRESVPAGRLLVFRAEDGWGPLCAFLGVPVPDAPYPRDNTAAGFQDRVRRRLAGQAVRPGPEKDSGAAE
ncbi:sulfotransferase family protein [Nocardiopsis potens]|uniref:sulfotransferase family protein n=1 Tax=Nocardiopsis potens TaxID=1246458 RepID=UPI000380FFB0|nr:sulfotransferase family protein [Nocardiopsis potens]